MIREEFMKELESLLHDISEEERQEAITFYNGYFEDAGKEQEEHILNELGTPQIVADLIKKELGILKTQEQDTYTECGYEDPLLKNDNYAVSSKNEPKDSSSSHNSEAEVPLEKKDHMIDDMDTNNKKQEDANTESTQEQSQAKHERQQSQQEGYHTYTKKPYEENRTWNIGLIILICIFAIPVGLPLMVTAFALFISFFAVGLSLFLGFGISGIACIIVGVALMAGGIGNLVVLPIAGIALLGGGLVTFGIGILLGIVAMLSFKMMPLVIKGFSMLCRLPFQNRRRMA